MPQTTVQNVHFSRPLETLSIDYYPEGLIAETIWPVVTVVHEADKYYVWNRGEKFRLIDDLRADGTAARRIDVSFTTDGYVTHEHALETVITDRERNNQDAPLMLELTKTRAAQAIILVNQEFRIAGVMANTANYAASNQTNVGSVAANQWNNSAFTGSIEQVLDAAKEAIRIQTGGKQATQLVIPKAVALIMKRDTKTRELIKYTHSDLLTDGDLPPKLWGLSTVIPAAAYNSQGVEGEADTMVDLWGKHVFCLYKTPAPGLNQLNYGYIFRVGGMSVKQWRDERVDSTFYRVAYNQVEKVVSIYAGYLVQNAIA